MRKAWHVDLKWISGIIFVIGCFITLNAFVLRSISSPPVSNLPPNQEKAIEKQLEDLKLPWFAGNIAREVLIKSKENPEDNIRIPLIGEIDLKGQEIINVTAKKAVKKVQKAVDKKVKILSAKKLKKPKGSADKKAGKTNENPEELLNMLYASNKVDPFVSFDPLIIFQNPALSMFANGFLIFGLIIVIISLASLFFFSHRCGKLISPGICLLIASFPGTISFILGKAIASASEASPKQKKEIITIFMSKLISGIVDKSLVYPVAFIIGFLLVIIGLLTAGILMMIKHKAKNNSLTITQNYSKNLEKKKSA